MNWPAIGVRGKFVVALVMAAALPLLVGVIVLHTVGFRYLMAERGRLHAAEARILSGLLEQAVEARAAGFRSWIAADRSLLEYAAEGSDLQSGRDAAERAAETRARDAAWAGLGENEEPVRGVLDNPGARSLLAFVDRHPLVAKMVITATPLFGRIAQRSKEMDEQLAIVLPDGRILSRWGAGDYETMTRMIDPDMMQAMRLADSGWILGPEGDGDRRMIGFSGVRPPGRSGGELPSSYVLISTSREAVVAPVRRQLLLVAAAAGMAVTLCAVAGYWMVHRTVLSPLKVLGGAARAVSATARLRTMDDQTVEETREKRREVGRNLRRITTIRTGDEVEQLAWDLAVMSSRVLRYHRELESEVAAKTTLIRDDLEMARVFQTALMPIEYPEVPSAGVESRLGLRFVHYYEATATVGGDFFDLIKLDDSRAAVLIADVMGHGARSALVTAIIQAMVRNRPRPIEDPGVFLGELNTHLHQVISRSGLVLFVTGFIMVLDTRRGRIEWSSAGHPAPLRMRRGTDAAPEPLWQGSLGQMALGLREDSEYATRSEALESGDVFLLFTDGAVEAEDPGGEQFGMGRLTEGFAAAKGQPLAALPGEIVERLRAHLCDRSNEDDICLVAVEAINSTGRHPE